MNALVVSHAPHIRTKEDGIIMMLYTILALLPAVIFGIFIFGKPAAELVAACVITCGATEFVIIRVQGRHPKGTEFLSAIITGLLIAMVVSPSLPWWMGVVGGIFAITIAKHAFGGLGYNIFNPALAARAFLLASWPVAMTLWPKPFDSVTGATHLALARSKAIEMTFSNIPAHFETYKQLFLGVRGGSLGETSILLLLIGALFLWVKNAIDIKIPLIFIATVAILSCFFNADPLFQVLAGGLVLGAFFMATDPVTKPISRRGRVIFAIGCGVITVLIRQVGGYPEGVCYAILIMNGLTPLLDRYVTDRIYGRK
jgi:Na+-translocating ferredoxin:NAD+ oxidoreductase subunit D